MANPQHQPLAAPVFPRRAFLGTALGALPLFAAAARAAAADSPFPGLILRQRQPDNLEFPFTSLQSFVTPADQFFVRNHFAQPAVDRKRWRLKVEGAVERPLELTYEELRRLPGRTVTATLECAGNGRVFLTPAVPGVQWQLGAVGNAEWAGVPLAAVLDRAGVKSGAVEVILEGADSGQVQGGPGGAVPFARSLPLDKARRPEVLLAHQMNGAELPAAHGFPVRGLVAGWYGMASVKWLTRVVVTDQPFQGVFQTIDYTEWRRRDGLPTLAPVTAMQVKASIARPALDEVVQPDRPYRVFGAAWAGESEVAKVEVSADGGRTWQAANLLGEPVPFAWRLWEWDYRTPSQPGRYALLARATDRRSRTQPMQRDADRRTYQISHVVPTEFEVR